MVPKEQPISCLVDRIAFLDALGRAKALASMRTSGVRLALSGAALTVSVVNPDAGESSESIDAECEAELAIGFSASYLIDALSVLADEKVTLGFTDDVSPGTIRAASTPEWLYVIMPYRLD